MFKFLKEKIKNSISRISKKIDEEGATEEVKEEKIEKPIEKAEVKEKPEIKEEKREQKFDVDELLEEIEKEAEEKAEIKEKPKEEVKEQAEEATEKPAVEEKKGFFSKIKESFQKIEKRFEAEKEKTLEEEKEAIKEEIKLEKEKAEEEAPIEKEAEKAVKEEEEKQLEKERIEKEKEFEKIEKKKGFFEKIKEKIETKKISEKQFDEMFWDMETALLENNVAVEVIEKIKNDLKEKIVEKPIKRSQIEKIIESSLKNSINDLFEVESIALLKKIKEKPEKPFVIAFVGINGSGKTTTIAKMAKMLKGNKLSCILAAADTFRAASIEQLQRHADLLDIKMIKHDYGSDPAAVAFDAIKHAKSKNADVVLIDTAGRMHSNVNLMDELKKVIRVAEPDLKLFIGEAITGNDCIEQAQTFNDAIGIDGIILAKADVDEKGGAAVSVSYVTKKPILYLGVGQDYNDLEVFDRDKIIKNIGLAA